MFKREIPVILATLLIGGAFPAADALILEDDQSEGLDTIVAAPVDELAQLSILPAGGSLINCSQAQVLDFHYVPGSASPALRGYELVFTADSELSFDAGDIVDSGVLGGIGDYHFEVVDNEDGSFSVAGVLLGPTDGLSEEADLFHVDFHGAASGAGQVMILSYILRDLSNEDYFATLEEAVVDVDCDPPGPVASLNCFPSHEQVIVTWLDPADVDVDFLEVWRGVWHDGDNVSAYPEYDDIPGNTIPTRPADREEAFVSSEWEFAGTALPGDEGYIDYFPPRGIYYYEVFARDLAENFGPPAAANDRAINYWLGDVRDSGTGDGSYDGIVNDDDMAAFDLSFGLYDGDLGYDNEIDVGETDDMSRVGFPTTDDIIDFEDLMIFAMNHIPLVPPHLPSGTEYAHLTWLDVGAQSWVLVLLDPCLDLKGLRLEATLSGPGAAVVAPGGLLNLQDAPYYLNNIEAHGFDVSVAILGTNLNIEGAGILFQVVLPEGVVPSFLQVTARDKNNAPVDVVLDPTAAPELPREYRLTGNWPNPFNPVTEIRFELPAAQHVRLEVYSAEGRLVTRLTDEELPAGRHAQIWNGRDQAGASQASGLYFARIEAGSWQASHKMLLVK